MSRPKTLPSLYNPLSILGIETQDIENLVLAIIVVNEDEIWLIVMSHKLELEFELRSRMQQLANVDDKWLLAGYTSAALESDGLEKRNGSPIAVNLCGCNSMSVFLLSFYFDFKASSKNEWRGC
jgi:hypothetical protein